MENAETLQKHMKITMFAPSRQPRRSLTKAIRSSHGPLLSPQAAFKNPRAAWGPLGSLLGTPKSLLEVPTGVHLEHRNVQCCIGFATFLKVCSFVCFRPCPPQSCSRSGKAARLRSKQAKPMVCSIVRFLALSQPAASGQRPAASGQRPAASGQQPSTQSPAQPANIA